MSRGELVEIGGSFRIPEIVEKAGARLVEVGTTNRTHPDDYRHALGPRTGCLLKVHRSNFEQRGFVAEVALQELVALGAVAGVPVLEDLGSGTLLDLRAARAAGGILRPRAARGGRGRRLLLRRQAPRRSPGGPPARARSADRAGAPQPARPRPASRQARPRRARLHAARPARGPRRRAADAPPARRAAGGGRGAGARARRAPREAGPPRPRAGAAAGSCARRRRLAAGLRAGVVGGGAARRAGAGGPRCGAARGAGARARPGPGRRAAAGRAQPAARRRGGLRSGPCYSPSDAGIWEPPC